MDSRRSRWHRAGDGAVRRSMVRNESSFRRPGGGGREGGLALGWLKGRAAGGGLRAEARVQEVAGLGDGVVEVGGVDSVPAVMAATGNPRREEDVPRAAQPVPPVKAVHCVDAGVVVVVSGAVAAGVLHLTMKGDGTSAAADVDERSRRTPG